MKLTEIYNELNRPEILYHGSPVDFDHFDFSKISSGDGLAKYGWGFYFSDSKSTAIDYAKKLTLGKHKNGMNLYGVKIKGLGYYLDWNTPIEDDLQWNIIGKLQKMGMENEAEQMEQ